MDMLATGWYCLFLQYIDRRRSSKRRKTIASNHHKTVAAHKLLKAWKVWFIGTLYAAITTSHTQAHLSASRHKMVGVQTALTHFRSCLQRRALSSWLAFVSEERARKEKHSTALGHFKTVTLKKVSNCILFVGGNFRTRRGDFLSANFP